MSKSKSRGESEFNIGDDLGETNELYLLNKGQKKLYNLEIGDWSIKGEEELYAGEFRLELLDTY